MSHVTLDLGPMGGDVGAAQNHLQAIGYFHRIKSGANPLRKMPRLQNLMKGARREKGPCGRKSPVTIEYLNRIYDKVDWENPDAVTMWCAIAIAWFFAMRMSEYLGKSTQNEHNKDNNARHPILADAIEPLIDGRRAEWPDDIGEISICLSGSATDRLNQCAARPRNLIPTSVPNSNLWPVRRLAKLWKICPPKFQMNREREFATWRSGTPIKPGRVVALLRMAVSEQGLNPAAFSPHSMRSGGATDLYRATENIELVARMGRRGTSSISAYLRESGEVMRGFGCIMSQGGHTLHRATRDLISLRPRRD